MNRTRHNVVGFLLGLMGFALWAQASLPRQVVSAVDLQEAVQTLSRPSPRAPHPCSVVSANTLTWNDAGRLTGYTGLRQTNLWTETPPMPTEGLELGYDGLGARTVRTDDLVTRRVLVDRVGRVKAPLAELDENNAPVRYWVWGPGVGLLAQIEADGAIHYFHADENGSTLTLTDSAGNVTDQFAYSPWGELLGRSGTNQTPFTFVGGGGVTWEGGALYRMGARYYDARLKRWLSSDPAGMTGGANLYLYANANPLMWVDMLGLCGEVYFQNPSMTWDEQQESIVLRATPQEQFSHVLDVAHDLRNTPGLASTIAYSPSVQRAFEMNQSFDQAMAAAMGSAGGLRMVGGAQTAVVVGENMARVEGYASRIGAETFQGMGMEANRLWIQEARLAGKQVVDIGPDFARRLQRVENGIRPDSPFYNMERIETTGYENYIKVFERTGKYQGRVP